MKLYSTLTSPYGRIARIVVREKGLEGRVELVVVKTRGTDNPYYAVNPSGRVPYLVLDDGTGLEESALVSWYLDHVDGKPALHPLAGMAGLEHRRLEAIARSMLDGKSLWGREYLYREEAIRSATIIAHEKARAFRLADVFEREIDSPVMTGAINMPQITLACALHGGGGGPSGFEWRPGRPKLSAWVDRIGERDSVRDTAPPPRQG